MSSPEACPGDAALVAKVRNGLPSDETVVSLARVFSALGDPTRTRIVAALAQRELCVGDLAAVLEMSISAVSHQLRYLRALHIIRSQRQGRHIVNSLDDVHIIALYRYGLSHVEHQGLSQRRSEETA